MVSVSAVLGAPVRSFNWVNYVKTTRYHSGYFNCAAVRRNFGTNALGIGAYFMCNG